jgi:hypothetical protein
MALLISASPGFSHTVELTEETQDRCQREPPPKVPP